MAKDNVAPGKPARPRARLPRWKKLVFGLFATVLFFVLLEGGLWIAGVETIAERGDPYVGFADTLPLFVEETGAGSRVWLTTASGKLAWFNSQRFPKDKAPGVRRVFCLGGSTTYGRPYDDATSFSGWLRELLPSATGSEWEVINAGGISYASYRVAALMEELSRYEPDLFIIYTGHNEFLEERTYGDLRRKPALLLETAAVLGRSRTFSALQNLVQSEKPKAVLPGEVDAVLDHTVGPESYERDDALREQILAHFELNLSRIAERARDSGAEVLFVVPAVNLKDCSPFKSQHAEGLSEDLLEQWNELYEQAEALEREDRLEEALAFYQKAGGIDPRFAGLHFRMGRLLGNLGRMGEASAAFQRALDEDTCPLRAPSEFQEAVRRFAESRDLPVVDFDRILKNDCLIQHGHNAPGEEYFLDHVHPTIESHKRLAVSIIEELAKRELFETQRVAEAEIDRATKAVHSRIDRKKHAVAERNLAKVLNWAGKHEEAGRLALKSLETLPDDPECLVIAGAYLRSEGQLEKAIEFLFRAVQRMPSYPEARRLLGAMLVDARRLDEAKQQFLALARLEPENAAAWQMVGAILAEQGKYEEALEYYHKALELAPEDANLRYNLGFALARLNRLKKARPHLERALELNPDDEAARRLLRELNTRQ